MTEQFKDISKSISCIRTFWCDGRYANPFILTALRREILVFDEHPHYVSNRPVGFSPCWLEFMPYTRHINERLAQAVREQPRIPPEQTLDTYMDLPVIQLAPRLYTNRAICQRVPGDKIAFAPFANGILWTMVPAL